MFPNLGKNEETFKRINASNGNINQSKKIPWIRLTTSQGNGLILESLPDNDSLGNRYGLFQPNSSGAIGFDKSGNAVFMDESGDYGQKFQPQPLIESLRVSQNANALSNKFEFSIICHTLGQLNGITQYFMEPGYTVLVEFGWNTQDSITQRADVTQICNIANYERPEYVKDKVEKSNGTYYGALGFITGGDVSSDGTKHTVSVTVTSIGILPAYIQPHKGVEEDSPSQAKIENYFVYDQEKEIDAETDIGRRLFRQMFNQLPSSKKIQQVAALEDDVDSRGFSWSNPSNFINMDSEVIEEIFDKINGLDELDTPINTNSPTDGGPADDPLQRIFQSLKYISWLVRKPTVDLAISNSSFLSLEPYIRLELAFEIINTGLSDIKKITNGCKGSSTEKNFTIDISETICSAHKYIFSTDASKLWIPNKYVPDFGLKEITKQSPAVDKLFKPNDDSSNWVWNSVTNLTRTSIQSQTSVNNTSLATPVGSIIASQPNIEFPMDSMGNFSNDYGQYQQGKWTWGYLKDLYINFNFFKGVIDRDNLVAKDVVLEILNGLASAVNSYWQFEIVEDYKTGELKISEVNFVPENLKNGNINPTNDIPKLNALGKDSSVLAINYKMDIPSAVASKVIGNRLGSTFVMESREVDRQSDNLFAKDSDKVLEKLNKVSISFKSKKNKTPPTKDALMNDAFTSLSNSITLFPIIRSREDLKSYTFGNSDDIEKLINLWIPAAYSDETYLKYVELLYFKNYPGTGIAGPSENSGTGVLISGMSVDITLNGIAGLRVGDLFLINGCPQRYRDYPFQITKVDHEVRNGGWVTNIEARIRNIKM